MDDRWALYVDVEGFGVKWNDSTIEAFRGINALMQGIFWIGDRYYREPPDRLFAHQFGDGFLVASDFHEPLLDRAVLVAIALLRHLLANGETAKCAISEGAVSDIQNCYPPEVRAQLSQAGISFGAGVMTVSPVLGSALVRTAHLHKMAPSGPLLVMSQDNAKRISCGAPVLPAPSGLAALNWLRDEPAGLRALQVAAGFEQYTEDERISQLHAYVAASPSLSERWRQSVHTYLLSKAD